MYGAARIERGKRGTLFLIFAIVSLCFAARCSAAPVTAFVGEVASYGDYALQSGFFETFRDKLEESLATSGKLRVVMRRPTSEDAARFSLVHMDAIARGHRYRRERAGAALIRYADAACGRQDEAQAKEWRKDKHAVYGLGKEAAKTARELGASYGAEYLIFCNLGGIDVERVRSIWNANVRDFEMRAKEIHAEISYYLVHAATGQVYEGCDAMEKRGQITQIVVGQYGKGFTVEQQLLSVLDRQAKKAAEGVAGDGLSRLHETIQDDEPRRETLTTKPLLALVPFTSRVRITNLSGEELASYNIAEDFLLDEMVLRGFSLVDKTDGTTQMRRDEAALEGRTLKDASPRYLLAGTLTDLGISESKRPGSAATIVRAGLSVRVIDAKTGESVFVATGTGESAAKRYEVGAFGLHLLRFGTQEFSEECLYEAMQKAVRDLAEKLEKFAPAT